MNKRNGVLFLLILVFALPLVGGAFLYHYHTYFHFKTLNHGVLLETPLNGRYLYSERAPKNWHVIYIVNNCASRCTETYHELQQVKKALGKESARVDILLLTNDDYAAKIRRLSKTLNTSSVQDKIYLADPLGNIFMYYRSSTDPMNILKDLKRVLEVSQIG
ncbi:MAG: hypothetical protein ACD_60C00024G0022 [uncultured bacterium]|nr:MAG: hypothetical protein ACD_60C00024G0022 [uncultured bacterium]